MGIELEADLSIGVALGSKLDDIKGLLSKHPKPLFLSLTASSTGPGEDLVGRPPSGKIWNLLSVSLTGVDDHTALANANCAIYVDSTVGSTGLAQCVIPALAIPSVLFISKGTLWAHSSGDVVANFSGSGITATTNVQATMCIAEWSVNDVTAIYTR
jgi:hypothetical protein